MDISATTAGDLENKWRTKQCMANHRMVSNRVIGSAPFLQMPMETQALYFHLCLKADDDGVVEAYPIMRTLGASDDSLKMLVAKNFIYPVNQELVLYVIDWLEHNKIRPDRLVKSVYREILLEALPKVQLLDVKPRADTGVIPRQNNWTSSGRRKLSQVKLINTGSNEPSNTEIHTSGDSIGTLLEKTRGQLKESGVI